MSIFNLALIWVNIIPIQLGVRVRSSKTQANSLVHGTVPGTFVFRSVFPLAMQVRNVPCPDDMFRGPVGNFHHACHTSWHPKNPIKSQEPIFSNFVKKQKKQA